MILYIQNPKDSTIKLLGLTNEFMKVAGHKINIQKSAAFLYAVVIYTMSCNHHHYLFAKYVQ